MTGGLYCSRLAYVLQRTLKGSVASLQRYFVASHQLLAVLAA